MISLIKHHALVMVIAGLLAFLADAVYAKPLPQVIRLSYRDGIVSFSPAGETQWVNATLNRPLVPGDKLWTDMASRLELQLSAANVRAAEETSFKILNTRGDLAQFQLASGTLALSVKALSSPQTYEIDTPNLAIAIREPGYYRITVNTRGSVPFTELSVRKGSANVYGQKVAYKIKAGRRCRFAGVNLKAFRCSALAPFDAFDRWAVARDRRVTRPARYVSPQLIGYEDLESYGAWTPTKQYGQVWIPNRVGPQWAPYRDGHWIWLEQWGWTWVDAQPWGFAPFHYGRWVSLGGRWGWVPGPRRANPVYAPALVAFVTQNRADIAWFPLGPGEVYVPSYPVSRDYLIEVNTSNTRVNQAYITQVYHHHTQTTYQNIVVNNGITAVPNQAFVQAQPVNKAMIPISQQAVEAAPISSVAKLVPTSVSVQGTPVAAQAAPPANTFEKAVVVKTEPPPPQVPFGKTEALLDKNPGSPLTTEEAQSLKPAPVPSTAVISVVTPEQTVQPIEQVQPQPLPSSVSEQKEPETTQAPPSSTEVQQPTGTETPATSTPPATTKPQAEQPPEPEMQAPKQPATEQPPEPEMQAPKQPTAEQPSEPEMQTPKQPAAEQPSESEMQAPKQLEAQQPAEPEIQAPKQPETEQPSEPEMQAPKQPETEQPPEPEMQAPKQPETEQPPEPEMQAPKDSSAEPLPDQPSPAEIRPSEPAPAPQSEDMPQPQTPASPVAEPVEPALPEPHSPSSEPPPAASESNDTSTEKQTSE